jgi:hypothetical protein
MPLKKLTLRPGVNRENTRYTSEGGWYDCDKVRFRQGTPEKIGGWVQVSTNRFLGVCRSLINWLNLGSVDLVGLGTNLKYYIEQGTIFYDITPIRETTAAGDVTFSATNGSTVLTVSDVANGVSIDDFVTFSGAVSLGGTVTADVLNAEYQVTSTIDDDNYTVTLAVAANVSDTGDGGASVVAAYQLRTGPALEEVLTGWGTGYFGFGPWSVGEPGTESIRVWNHANFGEDLIFGPRGAGIYYWDATSLVSTRGVSIAGMAGASNVPTAQNNLLVSDVSRFVLCFGVNPLGAGPIDPLLIRWSDQENFLDWTPTATNQAGDLRLSTGTAIVAVQQSRQEILVWTDAALYSLQYLGPPFIWGAQSLGENISIVSPNAVATANNITYWMGTDKFYKYDGRVQTLRCDLRQFIFQNPDDNLTINYAQLEQVFAGTVEAFNEIWWFYCSSDSTVPNRYVVYNYEADIWYYGSMERTTWLDSTTRGNPISTYRNRLINQEIGVDDGSDAPPVPIEAYIASAQFDIDDGHNMSFIWRILPDITFRGSTAASPKALMTLLPLKNSGSGYTDPASVGGDSFGEVIRTASVPVEQFTGQINTRVRGRQMAIRIESDELGTTWQLGAPRIDIRQDGRR